MKKIKRVAIVGLGAVGSLYARHISIYKPDISLFGVVRNVESFWGAPIIINDTPLRANYRTIDSLKAIPIDLILLCVKSYQIEEISESLREIVGPDTLIIPLSRGLTPVRHLSDHFGEDHVFPSVLTGADISRNGRFINCHTIGKLYFGAQIPGQNEKLEEIHCFFSDCHIEAEQTEDIDAYLWKDLMLGAGFEQVSTTFQLTCGDFFQNERAVEAMHSIWKEIASVAESYGVKLSPDDMIQCEKSLRNMPANFRAVMLQDFWLNRKLETDAFGDTICEYARERSISIPANKWIQDEIKALLRKHIETDGSFDSTKGLQTRQSYLATPEKIANQLRIDIMRGVFNSNSKLVEKELAENFCASRSSVRSALQIIAGEGLLKTLPNGRREVLDFSEKQLRELFELRALLENRALQIIMEKKQSVYPLLARSLEEMEKKYRSASVNADWNDLDVMFHRNLVNSAENIFLSNAWESCVQLWYATMNFRNPNKRGSHYALEIFGKHKHLYELLLAGDRAVFPELQRHIDDEKETTVVLYNALII